ncbi:MAG: phosphatidate cytidylyltransferase [Pseudohongiellaceae bacterium]|jgi:phosphatidate cytidylyltransferase
MLWQRVVTSFALLALILSAVFILPASLFYLFILLVMGIAAWEWSSLAGMSNTIYRALYVTVLLAAMVVSTHKGAPINLFFSMAIVCWLMALLFICIYPAGQIFWSKKATLIVAGLPLFVPGWLAFFVLRNQSNHEFHILLLFFLVAAADIGAYFAGRTFGKYKLAVRVSPNKTWEGFAGGVLACTLLIVIAVLLFSEQLPEMNSIRWFKLVIMGLLIAAFSVVGDLFESMVKRNRDVKDSGTILPGHGGILDRIDGLTAAAPLYAMCLIQLGAEFL